MGLCRGLPLVIILTGTRHRNQMLIVVIVLVVSTTSIFTITMVRVRLVMLGGGVLFKGGERIIKIVRLLGVGVLLLGGGVLLLSGGVLLLGERLLVLLALGAGLTIVHTSRMITRRAVVVARRSCMIAVVVRCGAGGWVGWVHAAPTVESIGLILLCLGIHCHLKPVNYLLGRGFWGGDQMVQVLSFIAKHSHLKDKITRDPGVGRWFQ